MTAMRELYQEVIIDHGRKPRNFFANLDANHIKEGFNPLCGDKLTVYVTERGSVVEAVSFQGCGCAISMASASLMTESIKGKSVQEINNLFENFHNMVMSGKMSEPDIGKLAVLAGVSEYPARVKCATLAWHALIAALKDNPEPVTTET